MRIDPKKTQKEPTYQVVLDALALTTCYPAFLITASVLKRLSVDMEVFRDILQICPRLPDQEFDEPPSEEEILSFIKELDHTGNIKNIIVVVPDKPKGKSIDTSEGTGLKPGVPDVSTANSSKSKNKSWGDSSDEANEQGDDEDVSNQGESQATHKTEVPIPSSSISSDYAAKCLNFDNIPLVDTKVVSMLDVNVQHEAPYTSPFLTILVSVILEHTTVNPPEIVITASSTTTSFSSDFTLPYVQ
ncbi:hypothetical protein Tco_0429304 [Tanacetum coccineum]